MAEAVGLAASIAGLIGLAGQVLQGGLFIQQFFEDVRGASTEVFDLRDELELFTFVASDTKNLLQRANEAIVTLETANFTRSLERCERIVKEIGDKLARYVGNTREDKRLWWKRLKVASRKKALKDYTRRLERAKGQLLVVQSNLAQSVLLSQQQSLLESGESLMMTNTIVSDIHRQEMLLTGQIERLNRNFSNGHVAISENVEQIQLPVELIATSGVSGGRNDDFGSKSLHSPPTSPGGFEQCQQLGCFISELPRNPNRSSTSRVETMSNAKSGFLTWKTASTNRLDLWLMSVELRARDGTRGTACIRENDDVASNVLNISRRSIHASFRFPLLRRKLVFQYQSLLCPYPNSLDMHLRTYNLVPRRSPIFEACYDLDLPRVRQLFQSKSASPLDLCTFYGTEFSLINEVFRGLSRFSGVADFNSVMQGLNLLSYLLPAFIDNPQILNWEQFTIRLVSLMMTSDSRTASALVEVVRTIIIQIEQVPFESLRFAFLFITLDTLESPLAKFLLEQIYHSFGTCELQTDIWDFEFWENDRLMLLDPEGSNMKAAIKSGRQYRISVTRDLGHTKIWDFIDDEIFGLFEVARISNNPNLVYCCRTRLPILVQQDYDMENVDEMVSRVLVKTARGYAWTSLLEYAFNLELWDFLADILADADWPQDKIMNLFDTQLYAGVPELLDGQLEYQTQRSLRKKFVMDLVDGNFFDISPDEFFIKGFQPESLSSVSFQLSIHTGTDFYEVDHVIREGNSSLRQKLTPGSWNDDGQVRLVPGVDFNPFIQSTNRLRKMDMRDWLAFEDD